MLNAFEGGPKIVRLWGTGMSSPSRIEASILPAAINMKSGRVLEHGTPSFDSFVSEHKVDLMPGTRSIIIVDIHQVGSSCGFSVPFYDFKAYRPVLNDHFAKKEKRYLDGKEDESMDQ